MRLILFLAQAAAAPAPIDFDLAKLPATATPDCGAGRDADIVVCARAHRTDRIGATLPGAPEGMPKAELRIFGNARLSVSGEQGSVGGFTTNRAMIHLKVPL